MFPITIIALNNLGSADILIYFRSQHQY